MTDQTQTVTLTVRLDDEARPEEIDRATTQLYRALLASQADAVEKLRSDAAPAGAKGDPLTIGAISLALGVAAAPGVVEIIKNWLNRRHATPVQLKIKLGEDELEFSGPASISPAEAEALADRFVAKLKQHSRKE